MKDNKFVNIIFDIGVLILSFIVIDIMVTTLFQFINIPMSIANVIVSSIITIAVYLFLRRKNIKRDYIYRCISIVVAIILVIISTYLISYTYDLTADGNYYHKVAIGILNEGWNPTRQSSLDYIKDNNPEMADEKMCLWIDHYPKATWNFAASIYSITGDIESGKVIVFLTMISVACLVFAYLSKRHLKIWQSAIVSILLVVNPIICAQMFSYYVDGIMGLYIYAIILFLIMITDKKFDYIGDTEKWLLLASSIIICMNIKFTGLLFSGIFSILFYLSWLYKSWKNNEFKKNIIKLTSRFAIIVVIGVVIVGFSSYVKNTIDHKNPLYPLFGEGKVDIITIMQPVSFGSKNRAEKLFESIFSKSENVLYSTGEDPELKVPFTVSEEEKQGLGIPDLRIGGYGVLFSGIFIISIAILIFSIIPFYKINKKMGTYILLILLGVILTTVMLDEAWWARYSPQLYLIPIISLFVLFVIANNCSKFTKLILNVIAIFVSVILVINCLYFIKWRINDLNIARGINKNFYYFTEEKEEEEVVNIALTSKEAYGILFYLKDRNIKYNLVPLNNSMEKQLYNFSIRY